MRKRIRSYLLVMVVLLLSISLWKNYSYSSEKKRLREDMLSRSVQSLIEISRDLDTILTGIETESMQYEEGEEILIRLSNSLSEVHFSLRTFATYFPPPGIVRSSYAGILDFLKDFFDKRAFHDEGSSFYWLCE